MNQLKLYRLPFLLLGVLSLVVGVFSGLGRLGWGVSVSTDFHGPWMVCGFLGVVISLERAVATAKAWAYLSPLFFGLGSLFIFLTGSFYGSLPFMGIGSVVLLVMLILFYMKEPQPHNLVLVLGVAALALSILHFGLDPQRPISKGVADWMLFLMLTIVGERVELSRLVKKPPYADRVLILLLFLAFALNRYPQFLGLVFVFISIWLYKYDLAFRTWKLGGITRFVATCLIGGYFWLTICGVLMAIYGIPSAGPIYDAVLHSMFLGFVFSMIYGHAPMIFPAILGIRIPFMNAFYVHFGLLQVSLLFRVMADLLNHPQLRMWTSMVNAISLLLFFAVTIFSAYSGSRKTLSIKNRT
ncbi:MAG: hypothetical protein BroJett040_25140 [Oligoflexia bacterium]|nr:MAG: hypothetical protein BroJett040_25140 [Oligoflexia bacterium]